jgi:hypothetical protein
MALRYLTVNYRRAEVEGDESFEAKLRDCIDAELEGGIRFSQAPANRIMLHQQGNREFLLNEFADVVDGVAGIVCEIVPGLLQPVLKRQAEERQLTQNTVSTVFRIVEQAAADQEDFIQGLCYFYARNNHLVFVTVKGFRKVETQPFFSWLLAKFGKGDVTLRATLDRAQMGTDIGRVSKFRLRGSSGEGQGVALGVDREVRRRLGSQTVAWSKAEQVVQAILPQQSFERLIGSLGEKNRLVADVQWSVAGPRDQEVKNAIQDVVTELANMDDGIVGIAGKSGEIREGGVLLEEKRPFTVALENNIVIDFDHATDVLVTTFARWVADQKLVLE